MLGLCSSPQLSVVHTSNQTRIWPVRGGSSRKRMSRHSRTGSLKRRFKSCPDLQSPGFSGGVVTTAPAVGTVESGGPLVSERGNGRVLLGAGGVARPGRMLVPLAPMTTCPSEQVSICVYVSVCECMYLY